MKVSCNLIRDMRKPDLFAIVELPAVPRKGEYIWTKVGAISTRFVITEVGYDVRDELVLVLLEVGEA